MKETDFPALFQSADHASIAAQATYLWLLRLEYLLLFAAAVVSLWFGASPDLYILYAGVIVASSCLLIFMWVRKPEKDWYGCRALAESIKTATWRYTMRAEPFEDAPQLRDVQAKFSSFLQEILDANRHVQDPIGRRPVAGDQITAAMDQLRALPLAERLQHYQDERIMDQKNWYVAKAQTNRNQYRLWIFACIAIQAAVIVLALLRIDHDGVLSIWPTEPLLVLAASIVGWIQIKKFNELAGAYSLTAHEIGINQSRIGSVETEAEFSHFVNQAERAFSREHTQWVARQTD